MSGFQSRHIGPNTKETTEMLKSINRSSINELIDKTIPKDIRLTQTLTIEKKDSEHAYLKELKEQMSQNKCFKSFIGLGYYDTHTPLPIQRHVLENPAWYTAYTPYQAEISQGRLEALFNFQTIICELTQMDIANASLLDEGTAAAEAMTLLYRSVPKSKKNARTFLVSDNCFPQTIEVLKSRSEPLGIELKIDTPNNFDYSNPDVFGILLQYPNQDGSVEEYQALCENCHNNEVSVSVATDLMALNLLTPPGHWGADVVFGNSQRLGVPLGFGGPHAAFFATKDHFKRQLPGRVIGLSQDRFGNPSYRMALQTREQHIRREKATSNICTAQALLATMASMYALYHGPKGLKKIATKIHLLTATLKSELEKLGLHCLKKEFFDTLKIETNSLTENIKKESEKAELNFRHTENSTYISLDETCSLDDITKILSIFAQSKKQKIDQIEEEKDLVLSQSLLRKDTFLTQTVFSSHQSETKLMRYIKQLENKDYSLVHGMIPLGSCTMKLNAATQLTPLSWPEVNNIHPFVPSSQSQGYTKMVTELKSYLGEITGLPGVSLQPNSGAQGEYAGLMVIRAYHQNNQASQRNSILIPKSAHGTNPASAALAGMDIQLLNCDEMGNIDISHLKEKLAVIGDNLAGLMITYPSTHGVFEDEVMTICQLIHENGGLVYMDGANMNAQVGLTNPGIIGADVCHLNLHKTFAIPHGGGGPGMGPICVTKELTPYLPGHPLETSKDDAIPAIASAPYSSASILTISHAYISLLGKDGLKASSEYAILSANYLKAKLEAHYDILYTGKNNTVAHELIIDCRHFKKSAGVDVEDIAKRLMDYGFHAPTMSWPVAGTLMIEPTESEDKVELDRFCDAMIQIRAEIKELENKESDPKDNVLKNAPHPAHEVCGTEWKHSYTRESAAFPVPYLKENKFWPAVGRVDNAYGDRQLVCSCPSVEDFVQEKTASV